MKSNNREVPTIEFNKEKKEIRINGEYAGYIDASDSMKYEAVIDEHGLKVMVSETIKFGSPLPDGRTEMVCPILIFRPYVHIERARLNRERVKARKAKEAAEAQARIAHWKEVTRRTEAEFNEGLEGQVKLGGFF
jgi:hypothetical protein